jgi:lipopolysaccharide/colanic/teichoic acid biosynthesis glycosyltransferase
MGSKRQFIIAFWIKIDTLARVGSFLRRTHVDELPQLVNILTTSATW